MLSISCSVSQGGSLLIILFCCCFDNPLGIRFRIGQAVLSIILSCTPGGMRLLRFLSRSSFPPSSALFPYYVFLTLLQSLSLQHLCLAICFVLTFVLTLVLLSKFFIRLATPLSCAISWFGWVAMVGFQMWLLGRLGNHIFVRCALLALGFWHTLTWVFWGGFFFYLFLFVVFTYLLFLGCINFVCSRM